MCFYSTGVNGTPVYIIFSEKFLSSSLSSLSSSSLPLSSFTVHSLSLSIVFNYFRIYSTNVKYIYTHENTVSEGAKKEIVILCFCFFEHTLHSLHSPYNIYDISSHFGSATTFRWRQLVVGCTLLACTLSIYKF